MKIYMFYKLRPRLDPQFYAYTDQKEYAEMFNGLRKHFYMKEKDVPEKYYKNLKATHPEMMLQMHEFVTQNVMKFGSSKVLQVATGFEITDILLHKEDIAFQMLGDTYIPSNIFTKEYAEAFEELGYSSFKNYAALDFQGLTNPYKDFVEGDFEVDELGLFLIKYLDDCDTAHVL